MRGKWASCEIVAEASSRKVCGGCFRSTSQDARQQKAPEEKKQGLLSNAEPMASTVHTRKPEHNPIANRLWSSTEPLSVSWGEGVFRAGGE